MRGGMKDGYEPAPMAHVRGPAGNCYFRGDVGYSVSRDPSVKWAVTNFDRTYYTDATQTTIAAAPTAFYTDSNYVYQGDSVSSASMDNAWFGGIGIGCGSGSRGLRGEVMLSHTASRKFEGVPANFAINQITSGGTTNTPGTDPLHSSISSSTVMANGYYDFGRFGNFSPYVGAGVGASYNRMSEVYFTQNTFLTNRIQGDSKLSLAWSLMAGVGYQVTDRAVLDFGYRYMNYGNAQSGQIDNLGFVNPRVYVNDMSAHEFKVGLRYHFGSADCCGSSYQPMK